MLFTERKLLFWLRLNTKRCCGRVGEEEIRYFEVPNKIEHNQTYTAYKNHLVLVECRESLEGEVSMDDSEPLPSLHLVTPGQWDYRENFPWENKGTDVLTSHVTVFYSFPIMFKFYPRDRFLAAARRILLSLFIQEKKFRANEVVCPGYVQGANKGWEMSRTKDA